MKILIVDDDYTTIEYLAREFRPQGFEVLEAPGAMEAMRIIDENPDIKWVITDMVMPEVDGDQLITMLTEDKYDHIKIIAMTGQSLGFLTKTFAKHKAKKKIIPVLKPAKVELIIKLMKKDG